MNQIFWAHVVRIGTSRETTLSAIKACEMCVLLLTMFSSIYLQLQASFCFTIVENSFFYVPYSRAGTETNSFCLRLLENIIFITRESGMFLINLFLKVLRHLQSILISFATVKLLIIEKLESENKSQLQFSSFPVENIIHKTSTEFYISAPLN